MLGKHTKGTPAMRITTSRFLLALSLLMPASAFAQPYSALYIFGDSLSDSGNVAALTSGIQPGPSTAYTQGRFTNEFNYADGLATRLGLAAAPSLLGGTTTLLVEPGPAATPTLARAPAC
jgi:phospholipase/lecithinase/hemolysin